MPEIKVNGINLYYEIHGEGPAVVLAHGMGGNHAIWYQQIGVLAKSYQVITFDHRGFGNSTDPKGVGRSAYVVDLKALLDHLNIEKTALVGQSMGGGTCICFTCRYPERVSALVIADSLHGLVECGSVKTIMDQTRQATKDLDQIERVLGLGIREQNPDAAILYRQLNSFNATDRTSLKGRYENTYTPEQLANSDVPVLFIAGQEDILFPATAIREMQNQVQNSCLVEINDCGHSAFYERPVEFNDSVLSFLEMAGIKGHSTSAHSNTSGYQLPPIE